MEVAEPFTGNVGNCMMGIPERVTQQCGKNTELSDEPSDQIFQDIGLSSYLLLITIIILTSIY